MIRIGNALFFCDRRPNCMFKDLVEAYFCVGGYFGKIYLTGLLFWCLFDKRQLKRHFEVFQGAYSPWQSASAGCSRLGSGRNSIFSLLH